jgi:hypothetical protein
MDAAGTFQSIEEAQEKIEPLREKLFFPPFTQDLVLRIVDVNEPSLNDSFAYDLSELP